MLINAGASLHGVHRHDLCALASGSLAAIQALLNRGVDVNRLRDMEGWTPLHMVAVRRPWSADCDAVVSALTNVYGVDVNARTSNGTPCIQLAVGDYDALRCFISAGADVNSLDDVGRPMLHRVVFFCDKVIKRAILLLAAGADIDASGLRRVTMDVAPFAWRRLLAALLAADVDLSGLKPRIVAAVSADRVEAARRDIAKKRLDFVRHRALQVCICLQSLGLDALQLCEILQHACGPVAPLIAFHHWWAIATTVKHFRTA